MNELNSELKKVSKFLSYVLRHCPEDIGLTLDSEGWASVQELVKKSPFKLNLTQELIEKVVITNDKKRFKLSDDGLSIRANQGHSVNVDLKLREQEPPVKLYHGTASRFLDSIKLKGLKSGQRHHVHLSTNLATAKAVGQRYGKPIILKIDARKMYKQGHKFFLSINNVWLTDFVPPKFLEPT